jgi:hypothetical protein
VGVPVLLDLFSAEMNADAATIGDSEEGAGSLDATELEVYGPAASVGPVWADPTPGAGIGGSLIVYPPTLSGVPETWSRHWTLPMADVSTECGTYAVRASTDGNDQNGWRLRAGWGDDANAATPPPALTSDVDGLP